ncbi:MAG: hypothetical protein ACLPT4_10685 [Verrucomicrobiia bacterium]
MGHPKRPGIIDAKIAEEYVVCGICLTKNRVVSHRKAVRPVCGRCGYPLPDPFGAQPGIRLLREWITRYRRALAAITGLLLVGLSVWLASEKKEYPSSLLSGPRTEQSDAALINRPGAPVYAVTVVVRRETSTDSDDPDDLPPGSLPTRKESQADGLYGLGTPNTETWTKLESVVIVIDVCAGHAEEDFPAGGGHDGGPSGVFVSSYLQQMKDDPLNPWVGPHVVERIHINTGLDPRA